MLTEAGERYFATITDEIERITDATSTIRGYRSVTSLTVRATPTLSNKWLLPRLSAFLDRHPELEIRLDGTNEPTDFNRELVDLEIRHGDGRWPGLFVEGLAEETFVPACAPALAAPAASRAADLTRLPADPFGEIAGAMAAWFKLAGVQPARALAARPVRPQPHGDRRRRRTAWASRSRATMMMERELRERAARLPGRRTAADQYRHAMDRLSARSPAAKEGTPLPGLAAQRARPKPDRPMASKYLRTARLENFTDFCFPVNILWFGRSACSLASPPA